MSTARLLRCQHLKRWHTINTIGSQSLADHQWGVTMIAVHLHNALIGAEWDEMGKFILDTLTHDVDEVDEGDIPSPAKEATIGEHKVSPDDLMIRIADAIEAYNWIYNNAHGPHSIKVIENCHARLVRRCNQGMVHFGQELLHIVDRMLAELELPGRVF